ALAVAAFLVVSAVLMHDFWAVPEEQQQDEMTQFLKNAALAGGALAFLAIGGTQWPLALSL
ncbi:MAG: quinol oxidase, partial [Halobaculum sp.]